MKTVEFDLDGDEFAFYDELTHYVEDQSIRASAEDMPVVARSASRWPCFSDGWPRPSTPSANPGTSGSSARDPRRPAKYRKQQIEKTPPRRLRRASRTRQQEIIAQLESGGRFVRPGRVRVEIAGTHQADSTRQVARREEARGRSRSSEKLRDVLTKGHLPTIRRRSFSYSPSTRTHSTFSVGDGKRRPPARQTAGVGPHCHADPRGR